MPVVRISDLPPPPAALSGWPWTEDTPAAADLRSDGSPWPRISIVCATLNQGPYLETMLRSVLLQGYPDVELIVRDGGSIDQTSAVLSRYAPWISHCISAPDGGQAQALNAGLSHATGVLFNTLDSDDYLAPAALQAVGELESTHPGCVISGRMIRTWSAGGAPALLSPDAVDLESYVAWWRTHHHAGPGVFYPRAVLEQLGGIDETLHYMWDYELTLRFLEKVKLASTDTPLAIIVHTQGSKTLSNADAYLFDLERISDVWLPRFPHLVAEGQRQLAAYLLRTGMRRLLARETGATTFLRHGLERAPAALVATLSRGRGWSA